MVPEFSKFIALDPLSLLPFFPGANWKETFTRAFTDFADTYSSSFPTPGRGSYYANFVIPFEIMRLITSEEGSFSYLALVLRFNFSCDTLAKDLPRYAGEGLESTHRGRHETRARVSRMDGLGVAVSYEVLFNEAKNICLNNDELKQFLFLPAIKKARDAESLRKSAAREARKSLLAQSQSRV